MLREYRWSSYRSYIARDRRLAFVDYAPLLAMVASGPARRAQAYRRFVESGVAEADEEFLAIKNASPLSLGSEGFRERVLALYRDLLDARRGREDVAFRRRAAVLSPDEVLTVVCERLGVERTMLLRRRRDSLDRAVASRMLCHPDMPPPDMPLKRRRDPPKLGVSQSTDSPAGAVLCLDLPSWEITGSRHYSAPDHAPERYVHRHPSDHRSRSFPSLMICAAALTQYPPVFMNDAG